MIYGASLLHRSFDKKHAKVSAQDVERNFNIPFLKAISIGHKNLIADMFWIQTMIESDIEHYKNQDLGSWMYLRFKTVVELSPNFLEGYRWGSQYLMIVKDDLPGSEKILNMGLKRFPNDYELNYYMGFLYMSEYKDNAGAVPYYEKILGHPRTPPFMYALIARLKYKTGLTKLEYINLLKDLHKKNIKRERVKDYLENKIRELESSLDEKEN